VAEVADIIVEESGD